MSSYKWYWEDDDGTWRRFDSASGMASRKIESKFAKHPRRTIRFDLDDDPCELDFDLMLLTNFGSGVHHRVKRELNKPKPPSRAQPHGVIDEQYVWFWECDDGSWEQFSADGARSCDIEAEYRKNKYGHFSYNVFGKSYVIEFGTLMQINQKTKYRRNVKRDRSTTTSSNTAPLLPTLVATTNRQYATADVPRWYWYNDQNWTSYGKCDTGSGISSAAIERQYQASPDGSFYFNTDGASYIVDFAQMLQINQKTGYRRRIERRTGPDRERQNSVLKNAVVNAPSVVIRFPDTWDFARQSTGADFWLADVLASGPSANEYQQIVGLFSATMPNKIVLSVERIHNPKLYEKFAIGRRSLEQRPGMPGNGGVRRLFHGTKWSSVDAICRQGFDWRLNGKNATRYGKGSYFARDASYSAQYTDSGTLFVAQVLVGEFTVGSNDIVRPPPKDPANKASPLYDSCVDDAVNPSIFVTFERADAYPEYLVNYF